MSQNPQDNQSYPLRLPNYRFLHQGRYHPYPTFNRQQGAFSSEIEDVEIAVCASLMICRPFSLSHTSQEAPIIPTDDPAEVGPFTQQGSSATVLLKHSVFLPLFLLYSPVGTSTGPFCR